jgi:hypothetical protein
MLLLVDTIKSKRSGVHDPAKSKLSPVNDTATSKLTSVNDNAKSTFFSVLQLLTLTRIRTRSGMVTFADMGMEMVTDMNMT